MKTKDVAKNINWIIYIVLAILALTTGFVRNHIPQLIQTMLLIYFIVTIIFLDYACKDKMIDDHKYAKFNTVMMVIAAIILGIESKSTSVYLMALAVPVISLLLYMDYRIYNFLVKMVWMMLTVFLVLGFPGMSGRPDGIETILYYAVYTGASWVCLNFTKGQEFQIRKSFEQEQSLDDMLKVVLAKCEEARSATKSKSRFLSNMSHEIRTPINAILGMNEMILRESDNRQIVEYAANIESSGKMLLSLINDILDFSKIEAGKMELVNVEYQMSSVLNDIVNMIKPRADEKKLKLEVDISKNMPNILYGDEVRIRQLAINLLTNAVKYTDKGSVRFIMDYKDVSDDCIEIYIGVKDTGRGIKDEDKAKLFDSFSRVSEKENYNIEGTGLGLSITKKLLDIMGGSIGVESEYNKGSLFYIKVNQKVVEHIPIGDFKEQFEKSIQTRAAYHRSFTAPEARILVVDDNIMNIQVVKGLLKNTKINIDTATSGQICIEMMKQSKYNIVLLDHMMPGMDGVDTLNVIKKEHLADDIPVIALTANAVSGAREMYFEYGFNDYLTKPISGTKLEKSIRHWLPDELIHDEESGVDTGKSIVVSPAGGIEDKKDDDKEFKDSEDMTGYDIKLISSKITKESESEDNEVLPKCVDIEKAMLYSADGMKGIMCNIKLYIDNYDKTRPKLVEMYSGDNYNEYSIYAHSLGSTSATVGIMELSELARAMEKAGIENDKNYIKVHHEQMIQMYDDIVGKLKESIRKYETENAIDIEDDGIREIEESFDDDDIPDADDGKLKDILERLRAASDEFDSVVVDGIIEELEHVRISDNSLADMRKQAVALNEDCEYIKLVDLCEDMIAKI